ncbi:MAG: AMP-binding protein [Sphingobium sp.]
MTLTATLNPLFSRDYWTLPALLELRARENADKPFLQWTHDEAPIGFAEANRQANRIAHGLMAHGIAKGDRIVFFMGNSLAHVFCWFACSKVGAVDAPINTAFTGDFLSHQFNLCKARYAVVDEELVPEVARVREKLAHLEVLFVVGDPARARDLLPGLVVRPFSDLQTGDISDPHVAIAPSDPGSILYTSGTTGPSKGVLLPQGAQHFNAEQIAATHGLTEDDIFMSPFPLFHGSGRQNSIYPMLLVGGLCVLYPRFSGTRFVERAKRSKATITMFHGAMVQILCALPPSEEERALRLRAAICIPMPTTLRDSFTQRFGIGALREVIGMTETALPIIPPAGMKAPDGFAGCLIADWYDARVADPETGEELPDGMAGELLIRPREPSIMMLCYENMPEETLKANRDFWFHTGDAVRRNAEGWYGFVDRVKDSIRRRGENISSSEVEYQLLTHPAVSECAVIPVRMDEEMKDEEVKACIVCHSGMTIDPEEFIRWCENRLPLFAVPRFLEFVAELPKTPTGKTQKVKLRADPRNALTWDRLAAS